MMPRRLEPWEAVNLWHEMRGHELERVVGFANALASHYQGGWRSEKRTPLKWLNLPAMQRNALRRAGYFYIEDVEQLSTEQLLILGQIGPKGVRIIRTAIERFNTNQQEVA